MCMTHQLFSIWTCLWLVLLGSNHAAQEAPRPVLKTVEKIGLLPIKGEIDQISAQSLGRRLDQALSDGCDAAPSWSWAGASTTVPNPPWLL